ncbi:MAG: hypothetical protein ACU4F9_06115 [Arcticibacter sp.]
MNKSPFSIDPTYLRIIVDGLNSGAINKDNATALPIGLVGIYEEALPPASNIQQRKRFLDFFGVWALLKKEVSVAFVAPLLEGWSEEQVLEYINNYSKWFNSPVSGTYTLYHGRLRSFLLQKISESNLIEVNNRIISYGQSSINQKLGDEWERYSLEHLSTHLLNIALLNKEEGGSLKELAYNTAHWNRQIEISKGFDWSKKMLNEMMLWASKYDDDEVIECALNKVDLHHQEQNDAPRIVELVAQNDIETALQRIESFGGNDKEGLQRKFILYMLCLMELTLLGSKNQPWRKEAIENLLSHFKSHFSKIELSFDWAGFFPVKSIISIISELIFLDISFDSLEQTTNFGFSTQINKFSDASINQAAYNIVFYKKINSKDISQTIHFYFKNKLYSDNCYDKNSALLIENIYVQSGELHNDALIEFINTLKQYINNDNDFYNYLGRLLKYLIIQQDSEFILVKWFIDYIIDSFSLLDIDLKVQVLECLFKTKQQELATKLMLTIINDPEFNISKNVLLLKFGLINNILSSKCEFILEKYLITIIEATQESFEFIDVIDIADDLFNYFNTEIKSRIINNIENKIEKWDSAKKINGNNGLDYENRELENTVSGSEWDVIYDINDINHDPTYVKYSLLAYLLSKDKLISYLVNKIELFNWFYIYYNNIDNVKKKADESYGYISVLCLFVDYIDLSNELFKINETLKELERDPEGYVLDDYYINIISIIACHGYFNEFNNYYSDWFKRNYVGSSPQLPITVIEFIVETLLNKSNSDLLILYIKHIGNLLSDNPALSYRIAKEIHNRCGQKLILNDEQWSEFIKHEILYKLFYLESINNNEDKKIEYTNFLVKKFESEFSLSSLKIADFEGPDKYDYPGPFNFIGVFSLEKTSYEQPAPREEFLIINTISCYVNLNHFNELYSNLIQFKNDKFVRENEEGGIISLSLFKSECIVILRNIWDKKQNHAAVKFLLHLLKSRSVFVYGGEWSKFIYEFSESQGDYSICQQIILSVYSSYYEKSKNTKEKIKFLKEVIWVSMLLIESKQIDLAIKINKLIEAELQLFRNNDLIISQIIYQYWELRISLGLSIDESWLFEETITYLNEKGDLEYKQEIYDRITRIGYYKAVFEIFEKLNDKECYASTCHYLNVLKYVQKNYDEHVLYRYINYCEPTFDDLDEILFGVFNNNKFTEAISICEEIIEIFEGKKNGFRIDLRNLLEALKIIFSNREIILSIRPTAFIEVSELKEKGGMFYINSGYKLSNFIETLFESTELRKNKDKSNKLLKIFERNQYYEYSIVPTCLIYIEMFKIDSIWRIINEVENKLDRIKIVKRIIYKLLSSGFIKKAHVLYESINNKEDYQQELQCIYLENIITKELQFEIKYDGPINEENKIKKIIIEMIMQDRILEAEKLLLKIKQEKVRHNVLKYTGRKLMEINGYADSVAIVNKLTIYEYRSIIKYYIRLALNAANINKLIALHSLKDAFHEIDSIEHILKVFALHELYFVDYPLGNINRYRKTFNIQWAIDIKDQLN